MNEVLRYPTAAIAILLVATPAARGQVATPTLDHSAPFLGRVLELEVAGGVPGQSVRLLESTAADEVELPIGTLELDRSRLTIAGQGTIAADGTLRFEVPLSSDPGAAETELHFQAWVADPTAPAGAVLSEAAHLRILGPRVYVGCQGSGAVQSYGRAGLWVASAVHESMVLHIDVGAPQPLDFGAVEANVVLTPGHSRGAWMSSPRELLVFDPFFGGIEARVRFQEASRTLLTDSSGTRLAVLETGGPAGKARVHLLDFETAAPLGVIELPERASGHWASAGDGTAYVAVLDAEDHTYVRRVGLDDGLVHESVAVGNARSNAILELVLAADQLFVATRSYLHLFYHQSEFTRLDVEPPLSGAVVTVFHPGGVGNFTPVSAAGVLLFRSGGLPSFMHSTRLDAPSAIVGFDTPTANLNAGSMVVRDKGVWALAHDMQGDGQDQLYRMDDVATGPWILVDDLPYFMSGQQIDSIRDAFTDRIVYTSDHQGPPGFEDPPLLVLHDPDGNAEVELEVGYYPRTLQVVPVP